MLITASADEQFVSLWSVGSWKKIGELSGHRNGIWGMLFAPDGQTLITASRDHTVKFWRPQEKLPLAPVLEAPWLVGFTPDSRRAVTLDTHSFLKIWDLPSATPLSSRSFGESTNRSTTAGTLSRAGSVLALGYNDGSIALAELLLDERTRPFAQTGQAVNQLRFSADTRFLAAVSGLPVVATHVGTLHLWETASGRRLTLDRQQPRMDAAYLTFSHRNHKLAVAGSDDSVDVWDLDQKRRLFHLAEHTFIVAGLAFSPDDRTLASASWDTTVRLWDLSTGQRRAILKGHQGSAGPCCFSPDGQTLAVAAGNRTVRLWHVASQQEIATLNWDGFFLGEVQFSQNGEFLAAGAFCLASSSGMPGTVQFWQAPLSRARRD
jgi:WD40 repeat protein